MVDRSRVSREERERRQRTRACFRCGECGHFALNCPVRGARPQVGTFRLESSNCKHTCLPVTLEWPGGAWKTSTLLDSGAEESFLDVNTAAHWE